MIGLVHPVNTQDEPVQAKLNEDLPTARKWDIKRELYQANH